MTVAAAASLKKPIVNFCQRMSVRVGGVGVAASWQCGQRLLRKLELKIIGGSGENFKILKNIKRLNLPPRHRDDVINDGRGGGEFEEADDHFIADERLRRLLSRSARAFGGR